MAILKEWKVEQLPRQKLLLLLLLLLLKGEIKYILK